MNNVTEAKSKLEAEKNRLMEELQTIGGGHTQGSEEVSPNEKEEIEFADEIPDRMEELQENEATEENLKALLAQTEKALAQIDAGTYGVCEICGKEIEVARLEANPAATTCIAHL